MLLSWGERESFLAPVAASVVSARRTTRSRQPLLDPIAERLEGRPLPAASVEELLGLIARQGLAVRAGETVPFRVLLPKLLHLMKGHSPLSKDPEQVVAPQRDNGAVQ